MSESALQDLVLKQYLQSGDFNGLSAHAAQAAIGLGGAELHSQVENLVESGRLTVLFGDRHPNPHIRAFEDASVASQLATLAERLTDEYVIYPSRALLSEAVDPTAYAGRPYTLRLAHGAGQLEYASFELPVLDIYRRDPRYSFWSNDVSGTLSVGNNAYESQTFPLKHKVSLNRSGSHTTLNS